MKLVALVVAAVAPAALAAVPAEPPGRKLQTLPLRVAGVLAHVSAAGELADGRVVVTSQNTPAIWILDAASGVMTQVGSAGAGEGQYVRPGGVYQGANRTTLVLDRAQARVLVLSPEGRIARTYSIAVRGTSGGSDADLDLQRLDARDLAYFIDPQTRFAAMLSGGGAGPATVLRFDAVRQAGTPAVTDLRQRESKSWSGGDGMTFSQAVHGSPADGWGVAPDGRVAVVRADPYRVDWVGVDGRITRGPVLAFDPVPMTDADKQAVLASSGPGPTAGMSSGGRVGGSSRPAPVFAATKPPFAPDDILVSPAGRVWVLRSALFDAAENTYDVFDGTGRRIDRVAFPAAERVVGFGPAVVYVRGTATPGRHDLRKYSTQ